MTLANNKISSIVSSQVPFFVRNDHPTFIAFLEAYYEYLEQFTDVLAEGKAVNRAKTLLDNANIDTSIDAFVQKFYDNYINQIPRDVMADKTLLLKHIKDFYTSRGTEKSIKFLLRILFGEESSEFYYPKNDVLKASDGKWYIEKSVKIQDIAVDGVANNDTYALQNFKSTRITGNTSGAYATVERIDTYFESDVLIKELKISNQYKTFVSGEQIYAAFSDSLGGTHSITANLFPGFINTVQVIKPGTGYTVGTAVPIDSHTGTGGLVVISETTSGNIISLGVQAGGAGFQVNNQILISGGGGVGAAGYISKVKDDGSVHPNTYSLPISAIYLEANTVIANAVYSNLNSANANTALINATAFFTYANTGPISAAAISFQGSGYLSLPTISATANAVVKSLGILALMDIVDGGQYYVAGDTISFTNVIGGYGTGAAANVKSVDANGSITAVQFVQLPGQILGGSGYSQTNLPVATVNSNTGNGAIVNVTAILGGGDSIIAGTDTLGGIIKLSIVNKGSGYDVDTKLNLTSIGDGTAQADVTIVTGSFTYPGRYLNDDGHLSSYNFLEDRDYYQSFSYVVRAKESIELYRKALKDLIHPAGMKLFGEYLFKDTSIVSSFVGMTEVINTSSTHSATYATTSNANGVLVLIYSPNYNVQTLSANVYTEFVDGDTINLTNGIYGVNTINSAAFTIYLANTQSGTVSSNANTNLLTGANTRFDLLNVGDAIRLNGFAANTFFVGAVHNSISMSVTTRLPAGLTGNSYYRLQNSTNTSGNIYFTSV
jgi:hypothetical protein